MRRTHPPTRRAHGSALAFILIILVAGAAFLVSALRSNPQIERDKITADALVQAKEALIGFAATFRDTHPAPGPVFDMVFGYLPCPDTNNDGLEEPNCGAQNVSVIGRLPWRTLGLPPLRDSSGECLWYAVSGRYKDNPQTAVLNWDTTGQFIIQDAAATVLANGAVAVVFAARGPINNQARTSGANECGGDNTNNINAYLDGNDTIYAAAPVANADSTLTLSTVASIAAATNNDRGLWIAPNEIWERVRRRADFITDITNLLADIRDQAAMDLACTNTAALDPPLPGSIIEAGASGKNIGLAPAIAEVCIGANQVARMAVFNNWRNNVLYATCPSADVPCLTVNGDANCAGAVIFSGERAAGRTRPSTAAINYLEGDNLTAFTSAATVIAGPGPYNWNASTQDIAVCIPPIGGGGGGTNVSFNNPSDFSKFESRGSGVTPDAGNQEVEVVNASGSGGGCFWFPDLLTLNGKTLRAYYEFKFHNPDPSGGVDLGNGFTLSFLRGDMGKPVTCGTQSDMGAIPASDYPFSLFVETDIRQDGNGVGEPNGTPNHTAIMANGNTAHSATNGNLTAACNGTAAGCNHSPSNKFEEEGTPAEEFPMWHNQRVEIHSGYNSTCTASGGTYSLVKVWVDCLACTDTAADFASTPTVRRCINLDSSMNKVYFGFTGGFSSGGGGQGVTIKKFELRVD